MPPQNGVKQELVNPMDVTQNLVAPNFMQQGLVAPMFLPHGPVLPTSPGASPSKGKNRDNPPPAAQPILITPQQEMPTTPVIPVQNHLTQENGTPSGRLVPLMGQQEFLLPQMSRQDIPLAEPIMCRWINPGAESECGKIFNTMQGMYGG